MKKILTLKFNMKIQNGLLAKALNRRELELETFDLIDVFEPDLEERIEEYKTKAASLEMDVSQGVIPFPELSKAESNTWGVYCPQKTDLKEYTQTVPLEVIRLAEIIKEKGWFYKMQVWSENKEEIDPILVGKLKDDYSSPLFLLARWGASLKPYEEIRDIAKKIWIEKFKTGTEKKIRDAQRDLEDIDSKCNNYFNGGWESLPF